MIRNAPSRCALLFLASGVLLSCPRLPAQQAAAQSSAMAPSSQQSSVEEQLLQHLPENWRPIARRYRIFNGSFAPLLQIKGESEMDDVVREEAMQRLIVSEGAENFVVAHLDDVLASASIANSRQEGRVLGPLLFDIAYSDNWLHSSLAVPLLEREATSEPDPEISLDALQSLQILEAARTLETVENRLLNLTGADYASNKAEIDGLESEEEDLFYIRDQIDLPQFKRDPPPVFHVPTKSSSIRVVMMGDFGTRGEDQHRVAAAMVEENKKKPFDFGITLGDNFYVNLANTDDPNWNLAFEDLYGPMNITFYPCFGNHDWGGEYPAIELAYSAKNRHWDFPAPYYTYAAGPVQFFVLNVQFEGPWPVVPASELRWLQTQLDASKAKWKVVYGHVPIYTTDIGFPDLITKLLPVLKGRADVYISGHIHNLEQHKPVQGVNLFVIGASGRGEVPVHADPETIWAKEAYGFGVLEADDHTLTIHILGEDDKEMHSATFHK